MGGANREAGGRPLSIHIFWRVFSLASYALLFILSVYSTAFRNPQVLVMDLYGVLHLLEREATVVEGNSTVSHQIFSRQHV